MKLRSMVVLAFLMMMSAAGCKANNPAIGSWARVDGGDSCAVSMKFTNTAETITNTLGTMTFNVSYNVSPNLVMVIGEVGHINLEFTDGDHFTQHTAWGVCHFKRT